jgi:hypothetical protein
MMQADTELVATAESRRRRSRRQPFGQVILARQEIGSLLPVLAPAGTRYRL